GGGICTSHPNCSPGIGLGPTARALDVHRACKFGAGTYFPGRQSYLHRSRERSSGNVGGGTLEQGNRVRAGDGRTYGEGACRQTNAQSWRAKPDCALGTRHHPFAGYSQIRFVGDKVLVSASAFFVQSTIGLLPPFAPPVKSHPEAPRLTSGKW